MSVEHRQGCRRPIGVAESVMSAAAVALLAGCSASPGTLPIGAEDWAMQDNTAAGEQNTGLNALATQSETAAAIARQAADMQDYQGSAQQDIVDSSPELTLAAPTPPPKEPTHERPEDDLLRAMSMAGAGNAVTPIIAVADPDEPAELSVEPEPVVSRSTRIAQLASELAGLLKLEALEQNDPARPLIAAAMLEAIASDIIEEIDLPGGGLLMLTEAERASLISIRELAIRLAGQDNEVGGDPQRIREVLLSTAENLREHARVRIGTTELCVSAPGFGNYVPLQRHTFLAGRTNRMVIYTEVDHFGLRAATSGESMTQGDTVAAELTQELELYLRAGDPSPTWQRRIEWLPRTSRREFRDMFLASMIELPPTLAVGEYDLKVRVIDEVTGAQDEAVISIRLVADASALDEEPTGVSGNAPPKQGSDTASILLGGG